MTVLASTSVSMEVRAHFIWWNRNREEEWARRMTTAREPRAGELLQFWPDGPFGKIVLSSWLHDGSLVLSLEALHIGAPLDQLGCPRWDKRYGPEPDPQKLEAAGWTRREPQGRQ